MMEDGICPICWEEMLDPVAGQCGHVFCNDCIKTALRLDKRQCPLCREPIKSHRELRKVTPSPLNRTESKGFPTGDVDGSSLLHGWYCTKCTVGNKASARRCTLCHALKPAFLGRIEFPEGTPDELRVMPSVRSDGEPRAAEDVAIPTAKLSPCTRGGECALMQTLLPVANGVEDELQTASGDAGAASQLSHPLSMVGSRVCAIDYEGTHLDAVVIAIKYVGTRWKQLKVRFDGWEPEFDEWISFDSGRLLPEGSRSRTALGDTTKRTTRSDVTSEEPPTVPPKRFARIEQGAEQGEDEDIGTLDQDIATYEARACPDLGEGWVRVKRTTCTDGVTSYARPWWIAPDGTRLKSHTLAKKHSDVEEMATPSASCPGRDVRSPTGPLDCVHSEGAEKSAGSGAWEVLQLREAAESTAKQQEAAEAAAREYELEMFAKALVVGTRLRASDFHGITYNSTVVAISNVRKVKKVRVRFDGWGGEFDEWIPRNSNRLRPLPAEDAESGSGTTSEPRTSANIAADTLAPSADAADAEQATSIATIPLFRVTTTLSASPAPKCISGVGQGTYRPVPTRKKLNDDDAKVGSKPGHSDTAAHHREAHTAPTSVWSAKYIIKEDTIKGDTEAEAGSSAMAGLARVAGPEEDGEVDDVCAGVPNPKERMPSCLVLICRLNFGCPRWRAHFLLVIADLGLLLTSVWQDSEADTEATHEDDLDAVDARHFAQAKVEGLTLIPWSNVTGWKGV